MKKLFLLTLIVALFAACEKTDPVADFEGDANLKSLIVDDIKLSGEHFNLNIIGVKDKEDMNDIAAGGVIFVDLYGTSRIYLVEGDDFKVLDKNGTDYVEGDEGEYYEMTDGALFQLPDPEIDAYPVELLDWYNALGLEEFDTETAYSVFARPLGTLKDEPSAVLQTLADVDTDYEFGLDKDGGKMLDAIQRKFGDVTLVWGAQVPTEVSFVRKKNVEFVNVTAELLTVVYLLEVWGDEDGDPLTPDTLIATLHVRIPIFNEMLVEGSECWEYTNDGLRLLQLRFYKGIYTDVTYADDPTWVLE
uniref:hypothetical protein n=1 Tax=uncultured Draconibacterium sp. TaxID=1573823 RepID=UPI00321620D2